MVPNLCVLEKLAQEKGDIDLQLSKIRLSIEDIEIEHRKALQEVDRATEELSKLTKLTEEREQQEIIERG